MLNSKDAHNVELIIVGNELLNGTTLDTNSNWLEKQLTRCGYFVKRKITILDDLREISDAFRQSFERNPSWLSSVGGLGPTFDDKTIEGLAFALRRKIKMNRVAVQMLRESYLRRPEDLGVSNGKIPKTSLKMAYMPEGSRPLQNSVGSAPGVACTFRSTQIVALPGVPKEMHAIFLEQIQPSINKKLPLLKWIERWITVVDIGEPKIAPYLEKILGEYSPEVYIKSHAMGFRKGKSILKIQLSAVASEKNSSRVRETLLKATKETKQIVLTLGGKVTHG